MSPTVHLPRPQEPARLWGWRLLLVAIFAAAVWGLWHSYSVREAHYRHQIEAGLNAINQAQLHAIDQWREQRVAQARQLMDDTLLVSAVSTWLRQRTAEAETPVRKRLLSLVKHEQYGAVLLFDTRGQLLLDSEGLASGALPQPELGMLESTLAGTSPVVAGLHNTSRFPFPRYSVLVPLREDGTSIGGIWLVMNAQTTLFPILRAWPTTSPSAETLLVQRRSDMLAYLSPRRQEPPPTGAAPLSLASQVLAGARSVIYGDDYRGVPVVAAVAAIPHSDWLVISKIDTAEAFAEDQQHERLILGLIGSLALIFVVGTVLAHQRDAWQRERALKSDLQEHMLWLDAAQKAASIGYYAYDTQTREYRTSSTVCTIYGFPTAARITYAQWIAALHPDDRDWVLKHTGHVMRRREPLRMQHRIIRANDHQLRWIEVLGSTNESRETGLASRLTIIGTVQDITERKQTEAQLERYRDTLEARVRTDPLTQVANRLALDEAIAREWSRAQRSKKPLALLMIDVDLFKPFNDRYGHMAGDQCLRQVAVALVATAGRAGDLVARYGGEEFTVLLPGADTQQARLVADRLRTAVQAIIVDHVADAHEGMVTISVGVASVLPHIFDTGNAESAADSLGAAQVLLRRADAALYLAKQRGRNQVAVWTELAPDRLDAPAVP